MATFVVSALISGEIFAKAWQLTQHGIVMQDDQSKTTDRRTLTVNDHAYRMEIVPDKKDGVKSLMIFDGRNIFVCQTSTNRDGTCTKFEADSIFNSTNSLITSLGGSSTITNYRLKTSSRRKKILGFVCNVHTTHQDAEAELMGTRTVIQTKETFCAASFDAKIPAPFKKFPFDVDALSKFFKSDAMMKAYVKAARLGIRLESETTERVKNSGIGAILTGSGPQNSRTTVTTKKIRRVSVKPSFFQVPSGWTVVDSTLNRGRTTDKK
jgi:hypothetical protein